MFFVQHITETNGIYAKESYDFTDINQAKEKFHDLARYDYNAAVLPTLDYFLVAIYDEHGNKVVPEEYYRKPVQPEPEENPDEPTEIVE